VGLGFLISVPEEIVAKLPGRFCFHFLFHRRIFFNSLARKDSFYILSSGLVRCRGHCGVPEQWLAELVALVPPKLFLQPQPV